jgi:acylpyruvate hydrolase
MRFLTFRKDGVLGLAVERNGGFFGAAQTEALYPGALSDLIAKGGNALAEAHALLSHGHAIDLQAIDYLPPLPAPPQILCLGLNYADHSLEFGFEPPSFPTLFARFASSLIGHETPILRPRVSDALDFEGEMACIIGKRARHVRREDALDYVAGYSVFNDGSIRDYQNKTQQWTIGKNFDATGAFGPLFVTADALPPGGSGLKIETRLNSKTVQSSNTDQMIFDVAHTIEIISAAMTLEPGAVLVTGTPSGVGAARKPPLFMKPGDSVEVEIEGIGLLRNRIEDERGPRSV